MNTAIIYNHDLSIDHIIEYPDCSSNYHDLVLRKIRNEGFIIVAFKGNISDHQFNLKRF